MEEELKSGENLKPDASDRRPARAGRKVSQNNLKINISRQHFMIGGGIIILLLLIFAIASALKSPDKVASGSQANDSAKEINLSGSPTLTHGSQPGNLTDSRDSSGVGNADMGMVQGQPQDTNNPMGQAPQNSMQQDTTNNMVADTQAQQQAEGGVSPLDGLPVGPATLIGATARANTQNMANNSVSNGGASLHPINGRQEPAAQRAEARRPSVTAKETHKAAPARVSNPVAASQVATAPSRTVPTKPAVPSNTRASVANMTNSSRATVPSAATPAPAVSSAASTAAVTGRYTLQLSGASRPNTLDAFAKQQKLSSYQVYKTNRNGQPWYVLISGSYATPSEAKNAIAAMPAEVKAKNPWVRQVSQIQNTK